MRAREGENGTLHAAVMYGSALARAALQGVDEFLRADAADALLPLLLHGLSANSKEVINECVSVQCCHH